MTQNAEKRIIMDWWNEKKGQWHVGSCVICWQLNWCLDLTGYNDDNEEIKINTVNISENI